MGGVCWKANFVIFLTDVLFVVDFTIWTPLLFWCDV